MELRLQPHRISPHAALSASLPQENLSSEPSHHTHSLLPPSNSPPMLPHFEDENPQLQMPHCPLPDSDTSSSSASSQKRPNMSHAEGDKVPGMPTGMVTILNNPAFDGPLSPVLKKKKKKKTGAEANVELQTNTKTSNKRNTCQQAKRST